MPHRGAKQADNVQVLEHELNCLFACGLQGSFDHRIKAWQRWQDGQAMLQKKRETEAKLLWANKPDKLQQAKDEIVEVNQSG